MALEAARIEAAKVSRAETRAKTTQLAYLIADMLLYTLSTVFKIVDAEAGFFEALQNLREDCVQWAADEHLEQRFRDELPNVVKEHAKTILKSVQRASLRDALIALGLLENTPLNLALEYTWQMVRQSCKKDELDPDNLLVQLSKLKADPDAIKAALSLILKKNTKELSALLSYRFGPKMSKLLCVDQEAHGERWFYLLVLFELLAKKDNARANSYLTAGNMVAAALKEVDLENYPPRTRKKRHAPRAIAGSPRRLSFGS